MNCQQCCAIVAIFILAKRELFQTSMESTPVPLDRHGSGTSHPRFSSKDNPLIRVNRKRIVLSKCVHNYCSACRQNRSSIICEHKTGLPVMIVIINRCNHITAIRSRAIIVSHPSWPNHLYLAIPCKCMCPR